jgi:flagellar hook-associated protein 1 FlgK
MPLGLFGTLNLASRSLQTQRQGSEVAGHNLANVNTPGYARQRLAIETSPYLPTEIGPQGTGADAVAIRQLRDHLLDRQIQSETSVRGSLESEQKALQLAQSALGQVLDRQATGPEGASAATGAGGQHGLAEDLSELFNAFQSLSTNPTSTSERQALIIKAQNLSTQFNQVAGRLNDLRDLLDDSLESDVNAANLLLSDIAKLNKQIIAAEASGVGQANDLRDMRQLKIEELSKLVKIDTTVNSNGGIDIAVDGQTLVAGQLVLDTLETYDAGANQLLVRTTGGTALTLLGGSMAGTITARDGEIAALQSDIDTFASLLINEVNAIHSAGYGLNDTTGEDFFTGTDASTVAVNSTLANDPGAIQASGAPGEDGNNQVALQLAQLAQKKHASIGNQTFAENYGQKVSRLGQSLSSANTQLTNQTIVEQMLSRQRDSVSGVSLDEEMTDLIKFQRAFEASARLIVTIDEMLVTVVNLKR